MMHQARKAINYAESDGDDDDVFARTDNDARKGRPGKRRRLIVEDDSEDEFELDEATQQSLLEDGESLRGAAEGGQSWTATSHPKDPIPPYLLEGTAQALLTVQVIVNNLCEVKWRCQCEHHHRQQHRESHSAEHGSPEPPHHVLGSTRALYLH